MSRPSFWVSEESRPYLALLNLPYDYNVWSCRLVVTYADSKLVTRRTTSICRGTSGSMAEVFKGVLTKVVECHRRKLWMAPLTLTLVLRRLVRKLLCKAHDECKVVECRRRKLWMAPLTLTLALRRLVRKMTAEGAALDGAINTHFYTIQKLSL
ncbi:hypothetical protein F2Q68_00015740 [Brassica cretica]|uniref:Uncharacterized protein n=1 Tax=Brassica cretica TaxID=69181 RepID=A0A8S9HF67_BRACR|nr:hypothetical protein F2Q68_00015740 [Brassica cretica]